MTLQFRGCPGRRGRYHQTAATGCESDTLDPYLTTFDQLDQDDSAYLIIGKLHGQIVATCRVNNLQGLSQQGTKRAHVEVVRVDRDHRGKGIGAALFAHVDGLACIRVHPLVQLMANTTRVDAARFYKRLGF